ncbi:ABC transporter ATP-binding protein [Nocardia sp. 348MFTsu5.1]|uniref:ABC transporter ATP-binding protein n=1 Tax=Nocardia sp. 348MFTsu5.1 TaxID=1172185 RepID=UPI0003725A97|nr:ABC transporter ATP-binding protein [Nocardia sp. 348MFTsu5.1]
MLELSSVSVNYGSEVVISDLDLAIGTRGATVTALLGPSGCGKSTLIRAIAGLEPLSSGTITFDGVDLSRTPTHHRDFGVVFQDGQLLPGRSVADNVGYGLRVRRWRKPDIAERVTDLLDLVDLPGLGGRKVAELSGGQQQRVALARALAPRPRLLLLDEPLSALDRQLRDRLALQIAEIIGATGTPTIVVTHDHSEAAMMADRIAVMDGGRIVQDDSPEKLWRAPRSVRIAKFIGCTTVVGATISGGVLDSSLGRVPVDLPDGGVRIGLRPEAVLATSVVKKSLAKGNGGVIGTVRHVASLPEGTRVRLSVAADLVIDAVGDPSLRVGDEVTITLDRGRMAIISEAPDESSSETATSDDKGTVGRNA